MTPRKQYIKRGNGIKRKGGATLIPRGKIKRVAGRITRTEGIKKATKPKEKSISKLMKEADRLFSIQVRMKGAWMQDGEWWNRCFTSGYEAPVKKLHCGHYLSRFYKQARWDFDNARPQSMMANMWMRGDPINFRRNLITEIGEERVLAVEAKRDQPTKLTREFLESLINTLKASQIENN